MPHASPAPRCLKSLGLAALLPALVLAGPPPTDVEPVELDFHGKQVVDPYLWLEGSDAPEVGDEDPALDARVSAWTEAQNSWTRDMLDHRPGRRALEARLTELLEVGSIGIPEVAGGRLFYRKRQGDQAQPVLFMRESRDGEPVELVNPNTLDEDGLTAMSWFQPSQDGELVAFGLYRSGDENSTLYVMRVKDRRWLAEEIPGKVNSVSWLPDGSGFVYRRLRDLDDPYSGRILFHRLGEHHRQDLEIFEQYREGEFAKTWGPYPFTNAAHDWLGVLYFTGTQSNDVWVYDFERYLKTRELARIDIMVGEDAMNRALIVGDKVYLHTTLDAPNGRVLAVDLAKPGRENWEEIIPEQDDAVIESVQRADDMLVVEYLSQAYSRVSRYGLDGKPLGDLELPGIGTSSLLTRESSRDAFFRFESFNEPDSIYSVNLKRGNSELWERPDVPVDPERFDVKQVSYPSKDGTRVSMFVVHRKGLDLDGGNPTILYGYGGFNISRTPSFSPGIFPWLEAGGVYAVANLRGGGEYGDAWHRAGMLANKQNVFDDFIAAGEWLIEAGYTSPEHLGVRGGSNGGLLTAAVVVQRPDLFRAAHSLVPLIDMLRYQYFLMARYWVPEYGSSEEPDQFEFLSEYSPYHQVRKGVAYPAVLFTAGENDTRVHPLHARKMAARMQAATSREPEDAPILLWVEQEAGHGQGKPLRLRVRDAADQYIFMAWQLGLDFDSLKTAKASR